MGYESASNLVSEVKVSVLAALAANSNREPRVIILGALGRCGTGAADLCQAVNLSDGAVIKWDVAETASGGPFQEIATSDVFINCVYVDACKLISPFVTQESLAQTGRRLRVICDVSLDPNGPNNPVPVYSEYTSFTNPTLPVTVAGDGPALTVVAIDHLPTLVAREASDEFSQLLLPSLLTLNRRDEEGGVWTRAGEKFKDAIRRLVLKEGHSVERFGADESWSEGLSIK